MMVTPPYRSGGSRCDTFSREMDKTYSLASSVKEDNKILTRKHIAERQRRARINFYLEEIQKLTGQNNNTRATVKPEKAEVLEKAVIFLEKYKTEKLRDTEFYEQGFHTCLSALLDEFPVQAQDIKDFKGLKDHLETFLHNLTTEAETMTSHSEYIATIPDSYSQVPNTDWYQHRNARNLIKTMSQSGQALHGFVNGTSQSTANDQRNIHSRNLLCRAPENPKWFSDWNTQMQMQYIETLQDQHYGQDNSTYDAFQGIKSVYSNYLQNTDTNSVSEESTQHTPRDNHMNYKANLSCSQTSSTTRTNTIHPCKAIEISAYSREYFPDSKDITEIVDSVGSKELLGHNVDVISPDSLQTDSLAGAIGSPKIWRPW